MPSNSVLLICRKSTIREGAVDPIDCTHKMKSKRDLIETIQLITALIALGMTLFSFIKRFMDWSERFDYEK